MIVRKISASMDNERARTKRLIEYILNPETENESEKCAFGECNNFCNSDSSERMRGEIFALLSSCGSARPKSALQHWVLSWSGLEKPDSGTILNIAHEFMDDMFMANNQSVLGIHVNTENLHVHMAISRVNPATLTLVDDSNDIFRAHQSVARLENKFGCLPEHNALFKWSPFRGAYPNPDYVKNNSMNFKNISPEPLIVLLAKGVDPGEIPGMKRKENIYYSLGNGEISGILENGQLHLFKWAYKDIVRYLISLKEEKKCRIIVQNDLSRLFSNEKMSRKESAAFARANFNKKGEDLYTGGKVVPLPNDPFVLSRIMSIIPAVKVERNEIDNIYRHYLDLKARFKKRKIPESRVRAVAALMMRKEAVPRGDIEEVLRRDGVDTAITRHISSWIYSDQGNAAFFALEKSGIFSHARKSFQKRTRKKRIMKRKNYDHSASEIINMRIRDSIDADMSSSANYNYGHRM